MVGTPDERKTMSPTQEERDDALDATLDFIAKASRRRCTATSSTSAGMTS